MTKNLKKSDFDLFYRSLLYKTNTGLVITDGEGEIVKYNLEAIQLAKNNFSFKTKRPSTILDLFPKNKVLLTEIKTLLNGGTGYIERDINCSQQQDMRWVRITGLTIEMNLRQMKFVCIFMLKDITDTKLKQLRIDKKEQYFASIGQHLDENLFSMSMNGVLQSVNESFVTRLGFKSEGELLGKHLKKFCDHAQYEELLHDMRSKGLIENELVTFKKKDGSYFKGLINGKAFCRPKANERYFEVTMINITELHENHMLIQEKNRELEKLNAQLDHFFYSASHDLKSPLTSILGLCNLIDHDLGQEDMIGQYVGMIRTSVEKLKDTLEDSISFSKNSGRRVLSVCIDIQGMICGIVEEFKESYNAQQVDVNIDQNEPLVFYSDKYRVYLALKHVLKNAFQYIDKKKKRAYINIDIKHSINEVSVLVKDNGIGIAPLHLPRVFTMFYRATSLSKGSGMGLYIAKEALDKINAIISLEATPGKGTSVQIIIPNDHKGKLIAQKRLLTSS